MIGIQQLAIIYKSCFAIKAWKYQDTEEVKQAYDFFTCLRVASNSSMSYSVCFGKYLYAIFIFELNFIWNAFLQQKGMY